MADDEVSDSPEDGIPTTQTPAVGQPEVAPPAATVPAATAPAPAPILKTRWRDRAWSFRAMIAVAAASLVVGGIAGGVIVGAASDDDHGNHGNHRMGRWGPGAGMPPGWQRHGPRNFNGPGGAPGGPMMPYGNGEQGATPVPPSATPTPTTPGATG